MDLLAPVKTFDRFQRRNRVLGIPIAVLRNFSDQRAGTWAVQIAYYGFFSIFPLLLAFVSILGFVLQHHPSIRQSIVDSALKEFPIVGTDSSKLSGSGVGLSIGLVGTVWSGMGVTLAVETAFNWVYAIGPRSQPNFFSKRWRSLKLLVVVGSLQVFSTVVAGAVSGGAGKGPLVTVLALLLALAINLVLFFAVFRFMIPAMIPTRELWPGIVLAAVGWEVLQSLGGLYVAHVVKGASETYGTFATVIGLFGWLYLGARVVVYSAEVNVVLTRGLWPRSIMAPPEPADRRARAALAKMEERDDTETVDVTFHPPDKLEAPDPRNPQYVLEQESPAQAAQAAGAAPKRQAAVSSASPAVSDKGRASKLRRVIDGLELVVLFGFAVLRGLVSKFDGRRKPRS